MQQEKEQVRQIIARISRIDIDELSDDVNLREELGIDSLMAMEIIATIEGTLGIQIDEGIYADINTMGDFMNLVTTLCQEKNG